MSANILRSALLAFAASAAFSFVGCQSCCDHRDDCCGDGCCGAYMPAPATEPLPGDAPPAEQEKAPAPNGTTASMSESFDDF